MARRVFLHVGTPKSGTTFLQSLWWHHREALAERGLLLPGSAVVDHFHASCVVSQRQEVLERLSDSQLQVWDALLAEIDAWDGTALLSHELFARATPPQAAAALQRLGSVADEVHVVVTCRDLARQLPSGWQQRVKHGSTDTLRDFWNLVLQGQDVGFWTYQDLPTLVDRWSQGLPGDHRHLVVVRPGAPRDLLWRQLGELTGVDATDLTVDLERANESLGLAEVEVMRRLHAAVPEDRRDLDLRRMATNAFTRQVLVPAGTGEPFALPADIHAWAYERGSAMLEELRARELHVIGDLDDLVPDPDPTPGRTPDDVTDADVAAVAVPALSRMLLREVERRDEIASLRADKRRLRKRLAKRNQD